MAKENKKAAQTATVNENNIEEVLNKGLVVNDNDIPAAALAEIKKEQDDRTQRQIKSRIMRTMYNKERSLLNIKRSRKMDDVKLAELALNDRLLRSLIGAEVTEELIGHIVKHPDTLFNIESADAKAKTITIDLTSLKGEKKTYKLGESFPAYADYVDFDTNEEKVKAEIQKRSHEIENQFDELNKKFRARYGEYWTNRWYW